MTGTARQVLGEAMKLTADERAIIAAELLASLEPDVPTQARSEPDWIQEVERRGFRTP
jgi:hypothetical protein